MMTMPHEQGCGDPVEALGTRTGVRSRARRNQLGSIREQGTT